MKPDRTVKICLCAAGLVWWCQAPAWAQAAVPTALSSQATNLLSFDSTQSWEVRRENWAKLRGLWEAADEPQRAQVKAQVTPWVLAHLDTPVAMIHDRQADGEHMRASGLARLFKIEEAIPLLLHSFVIPDGGVDTFRMRALDATVSEVAEFGAAAEQPIAERIKFCERQIKALRDAANPADLNSFVVAEGRVAKILVQVDFLRKTLARIAAEKTSTKPAAP